MQADGAVLLPEKVGVLFVCTANICRSPTAEAMFRKKATLSGIADGLVIDSAATHDYRVGAAPDQQAIATAQERGYSLAGLCARQINRADLARFDFVLAMDKQNMTALHRLGEPDLWQKPKLIMSYSKLHGACDVPDPYGRSEEVYQTVIDMLESATDGLLATIKRLLEERAVE